MAAPVKLPAPARADALTFHDAATRRPPAPKRNGFPLLGAALALLLVLGGGAAAAYYLYPSLFGGAPTRPTPVADAGPKSGRPDQPPVPVKGPPPLAPAGDNPDVKRPPTPPVETKKPFDAAFIPESAVAAVVVHPKRTLASDLLAGLPQDEWFGKLAALGLDPRQVEEAVMLSDATPGGPKPTQGGLILRFARPVADRRAPRDRGGPRSRPALTGVERGRAADGSPGPLALFNGWVGSGSVTAWH